MINVVISGCRGAMGHVLVKESLKLSNLNIIAGVDKSTSSEFNFPVYSNFTEIKEDVDVIIDFSKPEALGSLLSYGKEKKVPLIICTTGFSEEEKASIVAASEDVPIFFSANMSIGINLMKNLLEKAADILYGDFDIEIIEKHHNKKVDSPSGTAYLLGDAIMDSLNTPTEYIHGRDGYHKRESKEIGMHSIRGGTIVGEHEVIFAGNDEIISFKHEALSKNIFAMGAFRAANFMIDKPIGLYDMDDILKLK